VIKPWVFEFFPAPREPGAITDLQRSADYFNWYLDLWPRAERLGYEGIFSSEHHFGPAYSPAPNLLIAEVALKTRTSDGTSWASSCLITSRGRLSRKSARSTI
jgi:hypothetical protein